VRRIRFVTFSVCLALSVIPLDRAFSSDKKFSDQFADHYNDIDWCPDLSGYDVLPKGKTFVSPNKKFTVQLVQDNRDFYFKIRSAQEPVSQLPVGNTPVYIIDWSPDSKSFIAIEHYAESSDMELIHWNGKKWTKVLINFPGDDDAFRSHVVDWKFTPTYITETFIANGCKAHDASDLHKYSFNIDLETGNVSKLRKTPISLKEYKSLRTSSN
jgi:hypothetical protein